MSKAARPEATAAQLAARDELRAIASQHPSSVAVVSEAGVGPDGVLRTVIRLPTRELPRAPGGLELHATEDVIVALGPAFPVAPPSVSVDHLRFAGHPHVLQGERLCVYLDPSREWHPRHGMAGFLEQLWTWFADAAAARFDAATALYHPVGGVLHRTEGAPTIVVRCPFPDVAKRFRRARLANRSSRRLDLASWSAEDRTGGESLAAVLTVPAALPYGAGTTLPALLAALGHAGVEPQAFLRFLGTTAHRNAPGDPLYFVLAVPSSAHTPHHLIAGRLPAGTADRLRELVATHGAAFLNIDLASIPRELRVEWCAVSDERPEVTTRRDSDRPAAAFSGRIVHLWGCGGLGSWMGEFIVRAGASRIVVCDPSDAVFGGLLVRQNFTEADVGSPKAEALASRLRAIADETEVTPVVAPLPELAGGSLPADADVLIDATVNASLGEVLDAAAQGAADRPLLAQVATDIRTGTLGVLAVAPRSHTGGAASVDEAVGRLVLERGDLERFHTLWLTPGPGDELVPARGCSTPTFHGAAADLAALAGVFVSLLGHHLSTEVAGGHLVALPHAPTGPCHEFVPI